MPKFLIVVLRIVVGVYVGLCLMLFLFQRSMIYYPQPRSFREGVALEKLDVHGMSVIVSSRPHAGDQAVIYFGGNAEDVSLDMPDFAATFPSAAIYLLHYPGYGGSTGKPSEDALIASGFALFDRVHAEHPNVTVIGRSLGTGVAVQVASQRPVQRLVLVTPFDSLVDVAAREYPFIPTRLLMRDKFESGHFAPRINAPTLILEAENDEVVPRSSTDRLLTRFSKGVARLVLVPSAGHNSISDSPSYLSLLRGGP